MSHPEIVVCDPRGGLNSVEYNTNFYEHYAVQRVTKANWFWAKGALNTITRNREFSLWACFNGGCFLAASGSDLTGTGLRPFQLRLDEGHILKVVPPPVWTGWTLSAAVRSMTSDVGDLLCNMDWGEGGLVATLHGVGHMMCRT